MRTKLASVAVFVSLFALLIPVYPASAVDYVTVSGSISNPVTGINPASGKQSGLYTIYVWLYANTSTRIASAINISEGDPFSFQIPANTSVQFDVYENETITPGLSPNLYGGFTAVTQFAQNTTFNIVIPQPYRVRVTATDYAGSPINGLIADFVDSSNATWYEKQSLVPSLPGLLWQVDGQHSRAEVTGNQFLIYSYGTNAYGPRQFRIQNLSGSPIWTSAASQITSDLNLHACIPTAGGPNKAPADCALDAIGQQIAQASAPTPTPAPTTQAEREMAYNNCQSRNTIALSSATISNPSPKLEDCGPNPAPPSPTPTPSIKYDENYGQSSNVIFTSQSQYDFCKAQNQLPLSAAQIAGGIPSVKDCGLSPSKQNPSSTIVPQSNRVIFKSPLDFASCTINNAKILLGQAAGTQIDCGLDPSMQVAPSPSPSLDVDVVLSYSDSMRKLNDLQLEINGLFVSNEAFFLDNPLLKSALSRALTYKSVSNPSKADVNFLNLLIGNGPGDGGLLDNLQEAKLGISKYLPVRSKASPTKQTITTITCVKGTSVKKVIAVKPICPTGYKKK